MAWLKQNKWPCLAMVLGWLVLWWPVWLQDNQVYIRDLTMYALPLKMQWIEALQAGRVPLWNPTIANGMPFLADLTTQTLYPLNLVFAFSGLFSGSVMEQAIRGLTWFCVVHSLLGIMAMAWWMRRLGLGIWISVWAGLMYGYSGYVVSAHENSCFFPAVAWIPFVLAGWMTFGGWQRGWLCVMGLSLLLLAGDPANALLLILAGLLHSLWGWRQVGAARLVAWIWVVLGFVGLTAAQWLPTLELWWLSVRQAPLNFQEVTLWSFPPQRLIEWIIPYFYGSKFPEPRFWGQFLYPAFREPWADSIYLGLFPVGLALWGGWQSWQKRQGEALGEAGLQQGAARFLTLMMVFSLLLSFGQWAFYYPLLLKLLPPLAMFRYPEKWLLWTTLAGCALAAIQVQRLWTKSTAGQASSRLLLPASGGSGWIGVMMGVALALILGILPVVCFVEPWRRYTSEDWQGHLLNFDQHIVWIEMTLLAGLVLWVWLFGAGFRQKVLVWAMGLSFAMQLYCHAGHMPLAPLAALLRLEPAPAAQAILASFQKTKEGSVGRPRIYYDDTEDIPENFRHPEILKTLSQAYSAPLFEDSYLVHWLYKYRYNEERLLFYYGLVWGLDYRNGRYSPLQLRSQLRWDQVLLKYATPLSLVLNGVNYVVMPMVPHHPQFNSSMFEVVLEDESRNLRILKVLGTLPRGYWATSLLPYADETVYRELTPFFQNYKNTVTVFRPDDASPGISTDQTMGLSSQEKATIELLSDSAEASLWQVSVPRSGGYFVTLESAYPGWRVWVDDVEKTALLAAVNHCYRGVPIEAGRHRVRYAYEPTSWFWGGWISVVTGILFLVWGVGVFWKRYHRA